MSMIYGLNGYMVKSSDKFELAESLRVLIENPTQIPTQIKSFGENSKHILFERFSVEEMV